MLIKDPSDVIHEAEALERYLEDYFSSERTTFEEWVQMFGGGLYRSRNEQILEAARTRPHTRVMEFACAGPFLADLLLEHLPGIQTYACTNFSPRMVDFCRRALGNRPRCDVALIDADVVRSPDMRRDQIAHYDLFLTTSFEHIQFDRELVNELPSGASFIFSVALFDDPEHFRVFESADDVIARYGGLLDIGDIRPNDEQNKLVVVATRPIR